MRSVLEYPGTDVPGIDIDNSYRVEPGYRGKNFYGPGIDITDSHSSGRPRPPPRGPGRVRSVTAAQRCHYFFMGNILMPASAKFEGVDTQLSTMISHAAGSRSSSTTWTLAHA